jgi:secondary thiamine-phosphate synthase enzyme
MPRRTLAQSPNLTLIFLFVLTLAFFPGLPQHLICLPFTFLAAFGRNPTPLASIPLTSPPGRSQSPPPSMSWFQKTFTLPTQSRGSYLITDHVVSSLPELKNYKIGLLHLFVQHTSCGLSLNENWDSDVRADMSDALDRIVPEDKEGNLYRHSCEGADDMPAHIKSALVGASVSVPIKDGKLQTGTWQGIWYLEFRASRHTRKVVATIQGETK